MSIKSTVKGLTPTWIWDRLHGLRNEARLRRDRRALAHFPSRVVRHNYAGVPLSVTIADRTAEEWYDRDWAGVAELQDVNFLRRHRLGPGARVFDVGAHQCVMALVLADVVGPGGSVVAVEANPHNAEVGRRNRAQNGADQLKVVNAAVSDRPGRITISEVLNARIDSSGAFGRIEVEAVTIDGLAAEHGTPDVLMIDIEGYEVHALRGARKTLESRPDVMIEVHVGCGLEQSGETVPSLLAEFPADAYDFQVAPGFRDGVACDCLEFGPYRPDDEALKARFFLAAIPRR